MGTGSAASNAGSHAGTLLSSSWPPPHHKQPTWLWPPATPTTRAVLQGHEHLNLRRGVRSRLCRAGDPGHLGGEGGGRQRLLLRPCPHHLRGDQHRCPEGDLHLRLREGGRRHRLPDHPGHLRREVRDHEGHCLWSPGPCLRLCCRPLPWRTPGVPRGVPDPGLQGPPCHCSPYCPVQSCLPCPQGGVRHQGHHHHRGQVRGQGCEQVLQRCQVRRRHQHCCPEG